MSCNLYVPPTASAANAAAAVHHPQSPRDSNPFATQESDCARETARFTVHNAELAVQKRRLKRRMEKVVDVWHAERRVRFEGDDGEGGSNGASSTDADSNGAGETVESGGCGVERYSRSEGSIFAVPAVDPSERAVGRVEGASTA